MWMARWIRCACVLVLAILTSCDEKPRDVTYDRDFGNFSPVIGVWKSRIPLRLVRTGGQLYLVLAESVVESPEELLSLPPGTILRIERLVFQKTFETSFLRVHGSIVEGPYANEPVELSAHFFPLDLPYIKTYCGSEKVRNTVWEVDPEKLEKVP